jgi:tetratricopeptide (TPR) repeat protein
LATTGTVPPLKLPLGLRQALERGNCVLFIGAGVGSHYKRSNGASAPDGKQLCKDLVDHFKLGIDPSGRALKDIAQLVELRASRAELDSYLKKVFQDLQPDETIQWLTTFRWRAIFTTNYDMGLERAFGLNINPLQNPVSISATSDLEYIDTNVSVPVFHIHGTPYPPSASPMVITQRDYSHYKDGRQQLWNRLKVDCATSTMLYVGYSGYDNNWQTIIEEIATEFGPTPLPVSYRIDPHPDEVDVELHRKLRNVETLPLALLQLREIVDEEVGDYRDEPDTYNKYLDGIPHNLRDVYKANPSAMLRLLKSWDYVNGENLSADPNVKDFLLGSPPNWSLIAQGRRFTRDVEDDIWTWVTDFATDPKAKSTAVAVTGPAGYGITTILMAIGLWIVEARIGPVFLLKEGADVNPGDVGYAATLFPDVPCYFFVDQAREHVAEMQVALTQQRKTKTNCLFVCGERRNEWLSTKTKLSVAVEFDVLALSDGEINRLLDFMTKEAALGEMKELDRPYQFEIVKRKHEQELLVTMREAAAGDKVGFDSIIDSEYRGIDGGEPNSLARELYLLVCCFYQHGILIRDQLLVDVLVHPLTELYETVDSLSGLVDYYETDVTKGEYAARARHRVIAQIVWKKCGTPEKKEFLLQRAMEKLNLTFKLDKAVFDLFIMSSDIINTFRTLEGKCRFFDTAEKRDRNNPYVLQHYARMLLDEGRLPLAMSQIERAIDKDKQKAIRILYHTRAMIEAAHAMGEENMDMARKWMLRSEKDFQFCIVAKDTDSYGYSGLATLYLNWAKKVRSSNDEATEYLVKAEAVISDGMKIVRDRASLLIVSSEIQKEIGNKPERLSKLRQAVDANSATVVGRYLLARAYHEGGDAKKAVETLDPIIKIDFGAVRSYIEYVRSMLDLGESVKKCAATLSQCRLDGATDPEFIGLYAGLLYVSGNFEAAQKIWDEAKGQNFSYEERIKKQYEPREADGSRMKFRGVVKAVKASFLFIQPTDGFDIISTTLVVNALALKKYDKVEYALSFSAKGPFAEHLQLVN